MNVFQFSSQVVAALNQSNFVWPDPPNEPVLGRGAVGPGSPDFFQLDAASPFFLVHPEASRDSEEHPADYLEEAKVTLYLFAENATQQQGAAVLGANRASLGSSRGRGLLEIEPLIKAQLMGQLPGVSRIRPTGAQPPSVAGRMPGVLAERALEISAGRLPAFPDYPPVTQLQSSAAGGTVTLTWKLPPPRWDLIGVQIRRLATGSTANNAPPCGTLVGTYGLVQTATDTPASSTYRYVVYALYDATIDPWTGLGNAGVANRFSSYGFAPVPAPPPPPATAMTVSDNGAGGTSTAGLHVFYCTFITALNSSNPFSIPYAESPLSPPSSIVIPANHRLIFTGIPLGPPGTVGRAIYGTRVGEPGSLYFFSILQDNTTTTQNSNGFNDTAILSASGYVPPGTVWLPATVTQAV